MGSGSSRAKAALPSRCSTRVTVSEVSPTFRSTTWPEPWSVIATGSRERLACRVSISVSPLGTTTAISPYRFERPLRLHVQLLVIINDISPATTNHETRMRGMLPGAPHALNSGRH